MVRCYPFTASYATINGPFRAPVASRAKVNMQKYHGCRVSDSSQIVRLSTRSSIFYLAPLRVQSLGAGHLAERGRENNARGTRHANWVSTRKYGAQGDASRATLDLLIYRILHRIPLRREYVIALCHAH